MDQACYVPDYQIQIPGGMGRWVANARCLSIHCSCRNRLLGDTVREGMGGWSSIRKADEINQNRKRTS